MEFHQRSESTDGRTHVSLFREMQGAGVCPVSFGWSLLRLRFFFSRSFHEHKNERMVVVAAFRRRAAGILFIKHDVWSRPVEMEGRCEKLGVCVRV